MTDTVTIPAALLADLIEGCETAIEELLERVEYCYDEESAESYSTAANHWESVADKAKPYLPKE
jgi:hypothetical protein